jgi:acetylornithine deacetylase/succinyl-diaminopimelate desuccinylase-like protein
LKSRGGRRAAAIVLLLLLRASPAGAVWPFDGADHPDAEKDLSGAAAQLLSRAIRFKTVNPPGDERPLAEYLVQFLKSEGVEAEVIETPSAGSTEGRAAVWARVRGSGRKRPMILHSHLDVVPASPTEWVVPPFEGLVGGGYVVGRGALDAKGITIVQLLALLQIARRDTPLDRDVILLATPDEETGGQQGAGFLTREHRALLQDAEFLLTEGGGILESEAPTPSVWGIAVTEKTPCWLRIVARGTPGHSSSEPHDAAVPRLIGALEKVRNFESDYRVVPEVARMFAALSPFAREEDRKQLSDLAFWLGFDPTFRGRFLADRGQNALVRNTVAITVLEGGSQTNVMPLEASAHLDARLLPGETCNDFRAQIVDVIGDPRVEVETLLAFDTGSSSPMETELFHAIERVAKRMEPGAIVVPRAIAGFTDAHYFRGLGITAYGFVPRWLPPRESLGIHGPNERVAIKNLERGTQAMVAILEEIGSSGGAQSPPSR